jgi:hypothetical protein
MNFSAFIKGKIGVLSPYLRTPAVDAKETRMLADDSWIGKWSFSRSSQTKESAGSVSPSNNMPHPPQPSVKLTLSMLRCACYTWARKRSARSATSSLPRLSHTWAVAAQINGLAVC